VASRLAFGANEEILARDGIVQFEGTSRVEPDRRLIVKFPDTFPSFPPMVFDTVEKPLLTRHHVPSTRQFCLFGPGNARWSAKSNVEAALNEVDDHITNYARGTPVPATDTVPEPVSALVWCGSTSIFVPPPISTLEGFDTSVTAGSCSLVFSEAEDGGSRGVVVKATLGSRMLESSAHYHTLCGATAKRIEARLLYLAGQPDAEAVQAAAINYFNQLAPTKRRANLYVGIVFPEQSGDVQHQRLGWMFARTTNEAKLDMIRAFAYSSDERNARVPNLAGLDRFKIVVVGCGCLGSKIAVGLAASGAAKFVLIDKDHIEPYNSVRHEIGVSAFGVSKAKALKKRLFDLNPATFGQVVDLQYGVGAINKASEEKVVVDHLASAELVIDATGMHGVSRWINQMCTENKVAAMYVSVTNGAWSGEIVRSAPGKACWACWNHQYDDSQPPGEQAEAIYPPGCDQPSFTGSTFETGIVANIACAVAVESLLSAAIPVLQYPLPYICWMGRDADGLPLLKVEGLPIDQRSDCPFCNGW
jgi:molybdopterin/thiamine biosynthesis adenylyltransferase